MKSIFLSIKPIHISKIVKKTKNYEFRSKIPKVPIDSFFVYESYPTSAMKYMFVIGYTLKYPEQIKKIGHGNESFNQGTFGKYQYAYEIKKVYELNQPIPLQELKNIYHFSAPQGFIYDDSFKELTEYLKTAEKKLIVEFD